MTISESGSEPESLLTRRSARVALSAARRNQVAVTVATFVGYTGFTLVMPFLPLYFEQLGVHDTGAIAVWSGLSLGVTPAITAALNPLWTRVAERYGRKLMVARALLSFVLVMLALSVVTRPWHVFALRALLGLFAGYGSIAMTMAAESSPPELMAVAIGWVQTAQRLGPALGPVVGGTLAQVVGLRHAFVVAALVYLAAFLLVVFGYRESDVITHQPGDGSAPHPTFAMLRRIPHFTLFVGLVFALQLVDRSFGPVLPLYLREIGTADTRVPFLTGIIFTTSAAAAAAGNQLTHWLLGRLSTSQVVTMGAAFAALSSIVFGVGAPMQVLLGAAVVFGFAIGAATTAVYTAAARSTTIAQRGFAFGYLTTAYLVGLAVSPVAAGLIGAGSMRAVFFADACGLAALVWIVRGRMQ
jgi:DHA1 family multidrug resistance protein-like MFS transporter